MRFRSALLLSAMAASVVLPSVSSAQGRAIDVTNDLLTRFFTAFDKQESSQADVSTQLADLDARIQKWHDCAQGFLAAGANDPSKLGFAAKMALKAKCGSTNDNDLQKQRAQILSGPENAAAQAGGFKLDEYRNLRDRLQAYMNGNTSGFTTASFDVLKAHSSDLSHRFGSASVAQSGGGASGAGMGAGMGMAGAGVWTTDFAWQWIGQLFAVEYMSGAQMFETQYKPGDWTQWHITVADESDVAQNTERAFIGRQPDGSEWWRIKTITATRERTDTVSLEALFKPEQGNEYIRQLVRMRAKLPGSTGPQELMVPQQWAMVNMGGALGGRPTPESMQGATLGTESLKTPAGTFRARHVQFGMGSGTLDWWLDSTTTGGWVKFALMQNNQPKYTMELIGKGTGAKSELGVNGAPATGGSTPALAAPEAPAPQAQPAANVSQSDLITADKLDRFVKGLNAMNTQAAKDSVAHKDGDADNYKRISLSASGLDENTFARMVERLRYYLSANDGASAFTAAEQALLKQRYTTLRAAMVHLDLAW
jgi:hypothetical protein